jgi:predicted membrane protein
MRRMLKGLVLLAGITAATRVAGLVMARQLDEGSEVSDEFRRVCFLTGLDFTSRAGGLREGEVSVLLGGARIDLRNAVLDAGGASILLDNTLGGVRLIVRDDWAVTVEEVLAGGGETDVRVTPPDELPEDAPRLHVHAITRLGGTLITTRGIGR